MLKRKRLIRPLFTLFVLLIDLYLWAGHTDTRLGFSVPAWLVIVLMVAVYAMLGFAKSVRVAFLTMLIFSLCSLLLPTLNCVSGILMALFLMARFTSWRSAWLALCTTLIPFVILSYNSASYDAQQWDFTLVFFESLGLWFILMLVAWGTGLALSRSEKRLLTERRWADEKMAEVTAAERLRISRDIHDSVAHSMTAIVLQVAGVRAVLKKGADAHDVDPVLAEVQSSAEQSMRELHRLLGMLRETQDSVLDRPRTVDDIDELILASRATGLDVSSQVEGELQKLDPSVSHAAYRVVQEGLSNAMKHAGEGARVQILIEWTAQHLIISVNSVSGLIERTAISGKFGLMGLRERISVAGGTLSNGATSNGYLLKATLPVADNASDPRASHTLSEKDAE